MTVQSQTSRADYNGNGATTVFAVPFYFLLDTDLQVIRTDNITTPATVVTLVLNSDYTVSGAGNPVGGSITAAIAPTNTQRLSILRNVPYTQLKHYVPNDPFPAASHEMGLDKLTMEVQQLAEVQSRALTLAPNTTGASTELPVPEANALLGWNSTADALQNVDPTTLATIVAFGTANADPFVGNSAQKDFTLSANPGVLANLDVAIGGVTQSPIIDYTWNGGTTLSFVVAPPNGVKILARYMQGLPQAYNPDLSNNTDPSKGAALVAHAAQSVDNVAALRTRLKTSASQWARTSGYYVKGDGGAADYYLDLSDTTSADNGGTIIVAADGGRWKLSSASLISVKQFGAVGNGVADDTAEIQACVNAVSAAGGGTVYIPKGTYKVSGTLTINTFGVYVQGDGPFATILSPVAPCTQVFLFDGGGTIGGMGIFNLAVRCFSATGCNGIKVSGVNPFWLDRVETDACGIALDLVGGAVQYITNFEFGLSTTAGIKISGAGNDQFISNGLIGNSGGAEPSVAGIWVESSGGFWLSNVDCIKTRVGLLVAPQSGELVSWMFVSQFAADTGTDSGIKFNPGTGGAITGCTFTNCWTSSSTGAYGVELTSAGGTVDGTQFNGHRSYGNWKDGYTISSTSVVNTSFNHCKASGNSVSFNGTFNGMNIAGNVGQFQILGGRYGVDAARPDSQGRGIIVQPGASNNYSIVGADCRNNILNQLFDGGTGTTKLVKNNLGFNPVANTAITVTASPFTYTNNTGETVNVFVTGGTVSNVSQSGHVVAAATNCVVPVPQGSALVVTYSVAPTMSFTGN